MYAVRSLYHTHMPPSPAPLQMIYGRTPFADLPFIPKMNAICNPNHVINFPSCSNPTAVDAIRSCLDRNPRTRIGIQVCGM